jgi:hypothetical protein
MPDEYQEASTDIIRGAINRLGNTGAGVPTDTKLDGISATGDKNKEAVDEVNTKMDALDKKLEASELTFENVMKYLVALVDNEGLDVPTPDPPSPECAAHQKYSECKTDIVLVG